MGRAPALLVLLFFSVLSTVNGQSTNAPLTGRVTDPSKATIAEAKVGAVNLGTNCRYESTTNAAGEASTDGMTVTAFCAEADGCGTKISQAARNHQSPLSGF